MTPPVFAVAGTDTGVGKTVFSAMLVSALDGYYWKPIQCGTGEGTDAQAVRKMTALPADRFIPERHIFSRPLSPHRAAELDGDSVSIPDLRKIPPAPAPLVIELAGGLLVPLTRSFLQIELLAEWKAPVILVARTTLGTINHTLLSCEALKRRGVPLLGIAFSGDANPDSESVILDFAQTRGLGRMPRLKTLAPEPLKKAFSNHFQVSDFLEFPRSLPR